MAHGGCVTLEKGTWLAFQPVRVRICSGRGELFQEDTAALHAHCSLWARLLARSLAPMIFTWLLARYEMEFGGAWAQHHPATARTGGTLRRADGRM